MSRGMMPSSNNPVAAPVRLAPIIRAPDREARNNSRRAPQSHQSEPSRPLFTVYVNLAGCKHSIDLLKEIRDVHRVPCSVIDVADGIQVPPWLKGTPSIVVGTNVYCGDTAFEFVASIDVGCDNTGTSSGSPDGQTPSFQDILSGKGSSKASQGIGCGLSKAFSPPVQISEEEAAKKYSGSVDDAVARLMQNRG